jgi:hypothetical protein
MKLYYVFSKNNKIGSRIISWGSGLLVKDLDKVPSHSAVLIIQDNYESFVFESTFNSGIRIVPYANWLKINEECYKIPYPNNIDSNAIFRVVHELWGKKYDWFGVLYFTLCFIVHFLFGSPFPKENAWQSNDKYFCNELTGEISGYKRYSMTTPAKVCSDFLKGKFNG